MNNVIFLQGISLFSSELAVLVYVTEDGENSKERMRPEVMQRVNALVLGTLCAVYVALMVF